jgi:Tfp pilus assembly protein PilN
MLRSNLSTRPFYNERIVQVLLACAAGVVIVLTAFNAIRIVGLSRQNTEFSSMIDRDRAEAARLTAEARRIRAGIDQDALNATAVAADGANRLIDQRTFSWTEFFNRIEATLPPDVMLTTVSPSVDADGRTIVQMTILGRSTEGINDFVEKLEATGVFKNVLTPQLDRDEEGLNRAQLRAVYSPGTPAPEAAAAQDPAPEESTGAARGRGAAQ